MAVGGAMYQWEEACSSRTGHTAVGGVIQQWEGSYTSGGSHASVGGVMSFAMRLTSSACCCSS